MPDQPNSPIPGWYPDPAGSDQLRWWDGNKWTKNLQAAPLPPEPETDAEAQPAAFEQPAPVEPTPAAPERPAAAAKRPDPVPAAAAKVSKPWYRRWWAYTLAGLIVLGAISAAFGDDSKKNDSASSSDTTTATTEAAVETTPTVTAPPVQPDPDLPVRISNSTDSTVHSSSVVIRGRAPRSAKVRINKKAPQHRSKRTFSTTVSLDRGENEIRVTASAPGYKSFHESVYVTRKLSAAEKAAARAAAQQSFIAGARTIPYKQLNKNADRYTGERVCYSGQIFQIQEDGDSGGLMLLSVTDMGYGIWDDNVWVDYDHSIKSAEDDIVKVCGTITGSKSYETQIGGETYVPRMHARYVIE